jgi:hypothetical protein
MSLYSKPRKGVRTATPKVDGGKVVVGQALAALSHNIVLSGADR